MNARTILASLFFLSSLHGISLSADSKPADKDAGKKITYTDDVLPIFRQKCGSCHNASDRKGGLTLDNYAAMMIGGSSGTVVEAGDSENSYLWSLITHTSEPTMPPNSEKLPAEQLAIIQKWIDMGALENSGSTAMIKKKPSLTKIEVSSKRPSEVAFPQHYFGDPSFTPSHTNAVTALASSPWAPLVAVSGYRQVGLYHTQSLELLGVLSYPEGQPQVIKFSRNGSLVLVGGGRGGLSGRVVVYDVKTGERKIELGDEYDEILAADISPDQSLIALGGPKRMLRIYSTATGELISESKKHTDWLTAIEFSPDGVLLASGDRSNGLIVWEAFSGQIFYDLQGHKGSITDVSWRPDANVVASASEDGTIKLWDMQNGNQIKSWTAHGGGVLAMDYTRDGELVSTGRDRVTKRWKGDGSKIRDYPALKDLGMEVAYDAESKRVLAGDWTGSVTIWNADDGTQVGSLTTNPPTVAAQLAQAEGKIKTLQAALETHRKTLAGLNQKIDVRVKAAEQAALKMGQLADIAKQATARKNQAEKDMQARQAALATAETASKQTQSELARINSELQQQNKQLKAAQDVLSVAGQAHAQAAKAEQAAAQSLAQAKMAADKTASAAQPTEAEKAVLNTDENVKQAVAGRQSAAATARAALEQASKATDAAKSALAQAQQKLDAAKGAADTLAATVKKTQQAAIAANALADQAVKGLASAKKSHEEAQAMVAAALKDEQTSAKAAADAVPVHQKAVEAAKPTADEQKAIAAANAAAKSAEDQLAAAKAWLGRLQKARAELAALSAK
jgi:WD40 repeat protein